MRIGRLLIARMRGEECAACTCGSVSSSGQNAFQTEWGKLIIVHGGGAVTGNDIIEQSPGQEISDADIFRVSHMHAAYISLLP